MIELKRTVSTITLTEQGVYHRGQVPADYSGPTIDVQVCHQIMFVTYDGNFTTMTLNAPLAKDSSGVIVPYKKADTEVIVAPVADFDDSSPYWIHGLPQEVKDKLDVQITLVEQLDKIPYIE